jgi:hypothetical protein
MLLFVNPANMGNIFPSLILQHMIRGTLVARETAMLRVPQRGPLMMTGIPPDYLPLKAVSKTSPNAANVASKYLAVVFKKPGASLPSNTLEY